MKKTHHYWRMYARYLGLAEAASHASLNEIDAKELAELEKVLNEEKPEPPTPPTPDGQMPVPKTKGLIVGGSSLAAPQINLPKPTESVPSGLAAPSPSQGGSRTSSLDQPVLRHNIPAYQFPMVPPSAQRMAELQQVGGKGKDRVGWADRIGGILKGMQDPGSLKEFISSNEKMAGFKGQAKAAIGKGVSAIQIAPQSPLGGMAEGMNAVSSALGAVGLGPIGAIVKLGAVVTESVDRLKKWNQQVHEANMQFADFSPAMAAVQAEQEIRDIRLSKMKGDQLAATARGQAEAKSRLDQATAPWEVAIGNMSNKISETLSDVVASIVETITPDFLKGHDEGQGTGLGFEMAEAGRFSWTAAYNRPLHLGPPPG